MPRGGKNCWPGARRCAKEMSLSQDTIWRGWDELESAGWMEMQPLPATRRRSQGALKVLKFASNSPADSGDVATTHPLTAANSPADSRSTSEGNQEGTSSPSDKSNFPSGKPCKKHPDELVEPGFECLECKNEAYWAEFGVKDATEYYAKR